MKVDLSISKRKTEWNWTLAFVLYCGGMDPSDILKHQSFRGLTLNHLCNKIQTNAWAKRRAEVAQMRATDVLIEKTKDLAENLKIEGIKHQEFMLSELRRERRVFEDRDKSEEGQMERMQILDKLDQVARRTSKLDEQKEGNAITNGFALLVHLQGNAQPALKNASTGILRSLNAHPDEAETTENDTIEVIEEDEAPKPPKVYPPKPPKPETIPSKPMPAPGFLFGSGPISS